MYRVLLFFLGFGAVGVFANSLSLQDRHSLQAMVLVYASLPRVVRKKTLMKCMCQLYRTETYDELRTLTTKLKNVFDERGRQTHDDVDLVTNLDLIQVRNTSRRNTI